MKYLIFKEIKDLEKMFLMILSIGIVIISAPLASAYLLPTTDLDLYLENEIIVMGQVTGLRDIQDSSNFTPGTEYDIIISQYIKGNTETNQIVVVGLGSVNSTRQLDKQTILVKGQQALFLLNMHPDGSLYISPYSISSESFNPDTHFILPPLKLYKAGISIEDIHCKSNLELAIKSSDNSPICLKPESVDSLFKRKWIR